MARMQQQNQRVLLQQIQQMKRLQQQAAKNQKNIKMTTLAKEFTLAVSDKVRVARKNLGLEYDGKGNVKEYSPAELKKLKDEKLPGYRAKIEAVYPGQLVYVYLAKPGSGKHPKPKVKVGDILGGKDGSTVPHPSGPVVEAVLILTDASLGALPEQGKRKNKKKK